VRNTCRTPLALPWTLAALLMLPCLHPAGVGRSNREVNRTALNKSLCKSCNDRWLQRTLPVALKVRDRASFLSPPHRTPPKWQQGVARAEAASAGMPR